MAPSRRLKFDRTIERCFYDRQRANVHRTYVSTPNSLIYSNAKPSPSPFLAILFYHVFLLTKFGVTKICVLSKYVLSSSRLDTSIILHVDNLIYIGQLQLRVLKLVPRVKLVW